MIFLLQIASLIRLAEGFRLGFVKCNQPVQCRQMAARLKEMLAGEAKIIDVVLKGPVSSLRKAILTALKAGKSCREGKQVIMVFGFEHSVPSDGLAPALDELNQSREIFPKDVSGPLLIWLPDYAMTRLAREAPDFWGWRSGVFEFYPELRLMASIEKTAMQDAAAGNLSLENKRERIAALQGLISDYYELQRGERENQALATVLNLKGILCHQLGKHDEAKRIYQESLKISQDLSDKRGLFRSLHQLGNIQQDQGNYHEATKLYQQGMDISKELGDKRGIAISLHSLGVIHLLQGNDSEAANLFHQSLDIDRELGDKPGIAKILHELGNIQQDQGNYHEATKLYQQSLDIDKELGDKEGIAQTLGQLGNIHQDQGNYPEAAKLYYQSMDIMKKMGDLQGIAKTLHNLGNIHYSQGNYHQAAKHYQQSLDLMKVMGNKQGIGISLHQLGRIDEENEDYERALGKYRSALSIFEELNVPSRKIAERSISQLKNKMGEDAFQKALESVKDLDEL